MSSSIRRPPHVEGTISRERPIGPVRLPEELKADFVREFNAIYQRVGLCLTEKGLSEDADAESR
ncbi:MAG: hypothetical protein AAF802_11160 [Planctomycetota bacterium]